MPVLDSRIGRVWVVGVQDGVHDLEEVEEPPLIEGGSNRVATIAFAQRVVLHVWMDGASMFGCRVWFTGFNVVAQNVTQFFPVQPNFE